MAKLGFFFLALLAVASEASPITDIKDITLTRNRRALVGQAVDLRNVTAHEIVGDVLFWAGPSKQHSLPFADGAELRGHQNVAVKTGRLYDIKGWIGDLRNPFNPTKFWRLINEREKEEILQEDVYIFTESIVPVGWDTWSVEPEQVLSPEDAENADDLG